FGGSFTFAAMCAVVCDDELMAANAIGGIAELVAKSLVSVSFEGPAANYRLSESTRAYAMEKLQAEGEAQDITLRHARYLSLSFQTRALADRVNERDNPPDFQQTLDDA
ncbi:hypothetical protein QMN58_30170, partial [Escherichia coli]|nr:hypothetical protein [Escherichia coli]